MDDAPGRRRFLSTTVAGLGGVLAGCVDAGSTGTGGGSPTDGDTTTTGSEATTGDATTDGDATGDDPTAGNDPTTGGRVTVAMTDDLLFEPAEVTVAVGDAVVWENVGTVGHSVTAYADKIPAAADFFASGGFDAESTARAAYAREDGETGNVAAGETYEHTFDVVGAHEYFCVPHERVAMVGTVEVVE